MNNVAKTVPQLAHGRPEAVATIPASIPRLLHVGCGPEKLAGSIGIDINPTSAADVIHDLDSFPYPFADDAFDRIICDHVLEHLTDIPRVMTELYRICANGGRIEIRVPHFSSIHYYRDPTHKHPFSLRSMDYFVDGTAVSRFRYAPVRFELIRAEWPPPEQARWLKRQMYRLINHFGDLYEIRLAFILPRHLLYFELTPIKP